MLRKIPTVHKPKTLISVSLMKRTQVSMFPFWHNTWKQAAKLQLTTGAGVEGVGSGPWWYSLCSLPECRSAMNCFSKPGPLKAKTTDYTGRVQEFHCQHLRGSGSLFMFKSEHPTKTTLTVGLVRHCPSFLYFLQGTLDCSVSSDVLTRAWFSRHGGRDTCGGSCRWREQADRCWICPGDRAGAKTSVRQQ